MNCLACARREAQPENHIPEMLLLDGRWYSPMWRTGQRRLPPADAWMYDSGWLRLTTRLNVKRAWICDRCQETWLNQNYYAS